MRGIWDMVIVRSTKCTLCSSNKHELLFDRIKHNAYRDRSVMSNTSNGPTRTFLLQTSYRDHVVLKETAAPQ